MKAIRNIGIFAHVDAGKTTLSEQILVHSGSVKQAGRVDNGTAHTDNLPVEQRRGISVKDILPRYQHQVEQALPLALKQGRLGWQVTDLKITLTGGNHHQFHTHPLDFIVATPMGIQDGLQRAGSVLLEPILECRLLIPADCVGKVMSDIHLMRGEVTETVSDEDRVSLIALLPVRTSMDYPTVLASVTSGRGSMSTSLHGYRECPVELGSTAPRTGTDPLDTARYILAARSALDGGIFDF